MHVVFCIIDTTSKFYAAQFTVIRLIIENKLYHLKKHRQILKYIEKSSGSSNFSMNKFIMQLAILDFEVLDFLIINM